jgi:hypothetical protein
MPAKISDRKYVVELVPMGCLNVIVEISAASVKACSFHERKSIPDTEIIYSIKKLTIVTGS